MICICDHPSARCTVSSPEDLFSSEIKIVCEECFNLKRNEQPTVYAEDNNQKPNMFLFARNILKFHSKATENTSLKFAPVPDCILPDQLFLGSLASTKDKNILLSLDVGAILNCADSLPEYFAHDDRLNMKYHRLPMVDYVTEDILRYLPSAMLFLEDCFAQNIRVLVHCQAGR